MAIKVPAITTPQLVMMPPSAQRAADTFEQPMLFLLFEYPRGQVDVIVLAHRDQDHK